MALRLTTTATSLSSYLRARPYHFAAALLFIIAAGAFYLRYLPDLPTGVHAWAQSDRLSLALNFYDYGLQFFRPRTSSLVSIGGVTGVEFPIQAYLAALGGVVFGRGSIVTLFRLLDVLMTVVGFYYMFRLVFERTGHFVAALVPAAFLLASPTYAFYAGSFMPDPFSLSLSFVAYYYWLRFFEQRNFSDLTRTLVLLTLGGLVKTTTALHLGAVVGITLLWCFLEPALLNSRQRRLLLAYCAAGIGLIVFFFLHNQHLNTKYLSGQFKSTANPIADEDAMHEVLYYVRLHWLPEYATITQYRTLGVCAALFLVFLWPNLRRNLPLTLQLLASMVITVVFVQVMGGGLGGHDYHMICSFGPPVLLLLILALLNLGRYTGPVRYATSLGLAVLVFFLVANGYKRLHRRMSDDYPPFTPYSHVWMRGGAEELKQAGVPAAANILVFGDGAPNTAMVYFDRRGIAWQPPSTNGLVLDDFLNRMATDSLDYLVMSPSTYAQLAPLHAAMAEGLAPVALQPAVVFRRLDRNHSW